MTEINKEEIRKLVREVLAEINPADVSSPQRRAEVSGGQGPRVLIVFHAGVRKLEEALEQVRMIEAAAGKSAVFTADSARASVCGDDVRGKIGARCILDTVKAEGLEKVLQRADVLVLPTFCLKVAAKVANLSCDDQESGIVLSALLQGKKVLASEDGFLVCDILVNEKIREAIDRTLEKLRDFGMTFCSTDQLSDVCSKVVAVGEHEGRSEQQTSEEEGAASPLRVITAKVINSAVDDKIGSIRLAPGGLVTPLARDLAREYNVKIIET